MSCERDLKLVSPVGLPDRTTTFGYYHPYVSDRVRLERSGPGGVIARVTLTRPDVHNALDATVIADLRTTFAALAREILAAGVGRGPAAGSCRMLMR